MYTKSHAKLPVSLRESPGIGWLITWPVIGIAGLFTGVFSLFVLPTASIGWLVTGISTMRRVNMRGRYGLPETRRASVVYTRTGLCVLGFIFGGLGSLAAALFLVLLGACMIGGGF